MLFANKTSLNNPNRSKTPLKGTTIQSTVPRMGKKQLSRSDLHQKQPRSRSKQNQQIKYRTKQSYIILQYLQDIYNELHFNQFEIFPVQKIQKAKKNIQNLVTFLGEKPVCRHHQDLLNLYCEHDKSALCVSCIYKVNQHKGHKIKSIQSVQKSLDLQTIRNEEKTKALIDQLQILQDQINTMIKDLSENFSVISKYTFSLIDQSIKELTLMRVEMQKKLSLAYRRTSTVIDRYKQSLELVVNHLQDSVQKTTVMNNLSKYMLFKELTYENQLIGDLVGKFNENKQLIQQWRKSNLQFQKIVLKKRNSINQRIDSIVVTEF